MRRYQVKSGRQVDHEIACKDHPEGETTFVGIGGLLNGATVFCVSWQRFEFERCI